MARIITIASGKGGVGKTTLTANLGIALAKTGKRVLLIDADVAMANLSLLLGMQSSPITLHDVLLGEAVVQDAIYDGPSNMKFIPSGLSLESYKRVDSERLETIVHSLSNDFDFILLDAAAGIEKNVLSALSASNEVLLITMPNSPSIADVLKTKMVAQRLGAKPVGVIVNFVRNEKGEISKEDIMKIMELPVYGIIPYDDEIRKSFMQQKVSPVMVRKPTSPAAVAISVTASKLTGLNVELDKPKKQGFFSKFFSTFKRKKKSK